MSKDAKVCPDGGNEESNCFLIRVGGLRMRMKIVDKERERKYCIASKARWDKQKKREIFGTTEDTFVKKIIAEKFTKLCT